MIVTYKEFQQIQFPLYQLPSSDWFFADGVLFLEGRVLDERNMSGKTLGVRRLQCQRSDLFPLKKAIFSIPSLLHSKYKAFIDANGKAFIYQKTLSSKLRCYKIQKVERKEVASLLWLHGVSFPITIPRPPLNNPEWARMLMLNGSPWIFYDYVSRPVKDTYRRV